MGKIDNYVIEDKLCNSCKQFTIFNLSNFCGVWICSKCGDHDGLIRCYCGWGLRPGERLEDDNDE